MKTQDELDSQLRRQAAADAGEFSEQLHRQVMAAVRQSAPESSNRKSQISNLRFQISNLRLQTALAAAAALLLGIAIVLLNPTPAPPKMVNSGNPVPIPSLPVITLAQATEPANRRFNDARFAYLDRDAQNFGAFLIRQVDVLPHNP